MSFQAYQSGTVAVTDSVSTTGTINIGAQRYIAVRAPNSDLTDGVIYVSTTEDGTFTKLYDNRSVILSVIFDGNEWQTITTDELPCNFMRIVADTDGTVEYSMRD